MYTPDVKQEGRSLFSASSGTASLYLLIVIVHKVSAAGQVAVLAAPLLQLLCVRLERKGQSRPMGIRLTEHFLARSETLARAEG